MTRTIVIYQMGKVGSSTLAHSLMVSGAGSFSDFESAGQVDFSIVHTHSHIRVRDFLMKTETNDPKRKIVILTMTRDPLRRTISAFFQNLLNQNNRYWYVGDQQFVQNISTDELIDEFRNREDRHLNEVLLPWFDNFSETLGLKIYDFAFPQDLGFLSVSRGGVDIKIMQSEKLNNFVPVLQDQLNLQNFQFENQNIGANKWYSVIYRDFLSNFVPTQKELKIFYSSRFAKHFYSAAQIREFVDNWST